MKFIWNGPSGAETIYPADVGFENGKANKEPLFEGWLTPGKTTLDLPEDHPQALVWKARGWLKPATEEPVAEEPATEEPVVEEAAEKARASRRTRRNSEGA
ncbi:hypothetical protein [Methylocystis sp. S23]